MSGFYVRSKSAPSACPQCLPEQRTLGERAVAGDPLIRGFIYYCVWNGRTLLLNKNHMSVTTVLKLANDRPALKEVR